MSTNLIHFGSVSPEANVRTFEHIFRLCIENSDTQCRMHSICTHSVFGVRKFRHENVSEKIAVFLALALKPINKFSQKQTETKNDKIKYCKTRFTRSPLYWILLSPFHPILELPWVYAARTPETTDQVRNIVYRPVIEHETIYCAYRI